MSDLSPLALQLRRSAESLAVRGGHLVPLRYGSAAGELAACMRSVGLVDREDLRVLKLTAAPDALDRLTAERIDGGLRPGQATTAAGAHWGRLGPDRALVVLAAGSVPLLCEQLLRIPEADETGVEETDLQAIGVIGPATGVVLTDLGIYETLAGVNGRGRIAAGSTLGAVTWMQLDDASALALVGPEDAVALWNLLAESGRRFGLSYVGAEAAERFEAIRRRADERARH
jgi:glycine cleavage system aminomethyltransferase T